MDILIVHVHTYDNLQFWKDILDKENTLSYTPETNKHIHIHLLQFHLTHRYKHNIMICTKNNNSWRKYGDSHAKMANQQQ